MLVSWSVSELFDNVSAAWSPENLPYTLAFWAAVGVAIWLLNRRRRPGEEQGDL